MHRRAEYGVAAHWKYKDDPNRIGRDADGGANDMVWLRQLLDWQRETADPGEFLDSLRFEIDAQEVYVFTPKGDVIALPAGLDPGRLRLRGAHRGRSPDAWGRGSTAGSCRWRACSTTATWSRCSPPRRTAPDRAGTGSPSCKQPPGAQQDPAVVLQGAPRGGDRAGQGCDRQGDAQAEPADPAPAQPRDPGRAGPGAALRRRVRALRRGRRGPRRRSQRGLRGWCTPWAGRRAPRRTSPRRPPRAGPAGPGSATPA